LDGGGGGGGGCAEVGDGEDVDAGEGVGCGAAGYEDCCGEKELESVDEADDKSMAELLEGLT
jgi:hypothetical protein